MSMSLGPLGLGLTSSLVGKRGGLPAVNTLFGVSISGAEYSPAGFNGQHFPTAANWTYLRSKRVGLVRFPIPWEDIQPTLGAALDTTYLNKVKGEIANAHAKGVRIIIEIHNTGCKANSTAWGNGTVEYAGNSGTVITGVNRLGDGTLTQAHFADLHSRLATALSPVLLPGDGIGIMNEPIIVGKNLLQQQNYFGSANWFTANGAVMTKLAAGSNPLGAAYGPAWSLSSGSGYGTVGQAVTVTNVAHASTLYARVASGTSWLAYGFPGSTANFQATTSWQRVTTNIFTPAAGSRDWVLTNQGPSFGGSGVDIQIANAQLEIGGSATTYVPNNWLTYAQAACDAIEAVDPTITIYVNGVNYTQASTWQQSNFELNHLTGANPKVYEAHQYFDGAQGVGGPGLYSSGSGAYGISDFAAHGGACVADYLAWVAATGAAPFLGEFGIKGGDSNWAITQGAMLSALRAAGVPGAGWYFGADGIQPSDTLNFAAADDARLLQIMAA